MAITWGDIELRLEWINKRDVFAVTSLVVLCFLMATVINDFVQLTFYENTLTTTQNYSMALLILHSMSFYFALLSFIYTTLSTTSTMKQAAFTFLVTFGNIIVFTLRISYEVTYSNYRREFYRLATESGK